MTLTFATLLTLAIALPAGAQTCNTAGCSVNTTVSVTVATVQKLSLSAAATALTAPTIAQLDVTPVADNGPSVTGKANVPFSVTISAPAAFTTPTGAKPASDVSWSLATNGTFAALSSIGTNVLHVTGPGGNQTVSIFYQTLWRTTNAPGAYTLQIVYTLTEP
jgi:hypothetical protein